MQSIKRILISFLALMATVHVVQAQDETIVFTPQWTAQAQFAGFYVAEAKGFFREAGVKVKIEHPSVTQSAMSRIRSNASQATTLQLCQAIEIVDGGFPLVNILQTSMNNGMVIISARGKDPLTQKGAKVGIWSVGFGQLAIIMSLKEHLDYKWVRFAQDINLFLTGALDATLALSYNEYYQLIQAGLELDEKCVYRFCNHGYNVQEGVGVGCQTSRGGAGHCHEAGGWFCLLPSFSWLHSVSCSSSRVMPFARRLSITLPRYSTRPRCASRAS